MKPFARGGVIDRPVDFPGYFAGASLKRAHRAPQEHHVRSDFPGYFAGASLKRADGDLRSADRHGTSPATSPGPH